MEAIQILGNLGEFVGALAVVATLIYLTIQVRNSRDAMEENSRLTRAAVIGTTFDHISQFRRHIIDNADVAVSGARDAQLSKNSVRMIGLVLSNSPKSSFLD